MTFSIKIDDITLQVKPNISILQACEMVNIVVPRFCYHERLSVAGNCRMCLVEVDKMPKLQASCAVPVSPNMSVRTNTAAVKKAREGVLEFILINHPLDCPICDQGGECDLQDQSLIYGGDRGRFKEFKRAVEDKNCGPLIKTIMTRCIHCTRCVRFANEIVGVPEFGTSGRGNSMEISTYVSKLFTSELSGNVIDLCPVGALTSKPYAFLSRPWELKSIESIDLFDSIHSNIRVDTRGYEVMRVLPRLNESINEEWISDKARFAFDGLTTQRLTTPLIKNDKGQFSQISWLKAIQIIGERLNNVKNPNKIGFSIGNFCDLESLVILKKLKLLLNSAVINQAFATSLNVDFQNSYKFNTLLKNISKSDICLLIGVNPKIDGVLLNYHLRKRYLSGNFSVVSVGSQVNLTFPSIHLGNSLNKIISILEGTHAICKRLRRSKNPIIIVGSSFSKNLKFFNFNIFFKILKLNLSSSNPSWNNINFFNVKSSDFSVYDLSLNHNNFYVGNSFDLVYVLDNSQLPTSLIKSKFVVYQGSHGCPNAQNADIILPSTSFIEKTSRYASCEGRYQYAQSATLPLNQSKHSFAILSAILNEINPLIKKSSDQIVEESIVSLLPSINFLLNKTQNNYFSSPFFSNNSVLISDFYLISSIFDNFYTTDIISQLSQNMSKCSKELTNKNPFNP